MNIVKILKTPFLQNTFGRLLLNIRFFLAKQNYLKFETTNKEMFPVLKFLIAFRALTKQVKAEVYLEPCQTSKMEHLAKIVND